MSVFVTFLIIGFLIFLNALYVAGEFSFVSSRRSRLSKLAEEGNPRARDILALVENPQRLDKFIATCQLGITLSSLILGFYGQSQLSPLVLPYLSGFGNLSELAAQSLSLTFILLFLTTLQVLLGELVPKNIGIQKPEQLALLTAGPIGWSMAVFGPLIWLFNGSGQLLMRLFGRKVSTEHFHIHSPEEILMLVEESSRAGVLQKEERRLLKNALRLRDSKVREVMIPRPHMLTAAENLDCDELSEILFASPYSRLPIYQGGIDNIVGVVHLKDLLCLTGEARRNVSQIIKPVPFVPETTPVKTVFSLLQRRHLQVAIVLDEFGGTAGMVTLEDLIEEIFGELQDEFDTYIPSIRVDSDNWLLIRGDTRVADLNEWLDLNLPETDVDTIGGLVLNQFGRVPALGDKIEIDGLIFQVEKMRGRGITAVKLAAQENWVSQLRDGER
ncbi:MAG TPA: hemolysin family protein [Anaerolineales bacterium]|nr:hemolysin family protein [Anaerolineales bacterium]